MTQRLSIIIPVYNGGSNFVNSIKTVMSAASSDVEVIVVSDASTDGSDEVARLAGAQAIRLERNSGPSAARNTGAKACHGDILLFLDADVAILPELPRQVLATFEQYPSVSAIFGSYDDAPAATNFASQYRNLLHHYVHQTSSEKAVTFWGGCGAVRRDAFDQVGGFPEERRYLEDIEFGYRLTAQNKTILLLKSLQVKHLKRWTFRSIVVTDVLHRALPWTELLLRYGQVNGDLNLRMSNRVSLILVYLLPFAACAVLFFPVFSVVLLVDVAALLVLNADLYSFFWRKRGLLFAVQAILWHWVVYYGGSGVGLILGILSHWRRSS